MFKDADDVFSWLADRSHKVPIYLTLLNLMWDGKQDEIIAVFAQLAKILKSQPEITIELIRYRNWRHNLVGNAVAILQDTSDYDGDLAKQIIRGSWVAPQLAAGYALLSQGANIHLLTKFVSSVQSNNYSPKTAMSAYSALKLMGHEVANEFEAKPEFEALRSRDSDGSIAIAQTHYDFWKTNPPISM